MDAANKIKDKGLARKLTTAVVGAIVLLSAGLVIIAAVVFTDIKATMKEVLYDVTLDSYKSVLQKITMNWLSQGSYRKLRHKRKQWKLSEAFDMGMIIQAICG